MTDVDNGGETGECPNCGQPSDKMIQCSNCSVWFCPNCITMAGEGGPVCLGCLGQAPDTDEDEDYYHDADYEYEDDYNYTEES